MKKFLMAVAGASILILGACGGGSDNEKADEEIKVEEPAGEEAADETPADETDGEEAGEEGAEEPTAEAGTYDAQAAEALYKQSCQGCHGASFDQQPGIKPINEFDAETIKNAAINGSANGKMPAILAGKEAEAENLAAWLADQ